MRDMNRMKKFESSSGQKLYRPGYAWCVEESEVMHHGATMRSTILLKCSLPSMQAREQQVQIYA